MRKLGEVLAAGIPYSVFEAPAEGELEENLGLCRYGRHQIFVREGLSPEAAKDTLFHEISHAVWNESGAKQLLKGSIAERLDVDELEETLIQILTPHFLRAMASIAAWKKPRSRISVIPLKKRGRRA